MSATEERQTAPERRHRTHVGKAGSGEAYQAVCSCGWLSKGTYDTSAEAGAVGEEHATLATSDEAQCELEAELERRAEWDKPQHIVTCPNCDSENLQEVGCVTYWHHGTVTADEDGREFEEHGDTSYGDDYRPTHVECGDCLHVVYVLGPDPHDSSAPALRQRVTAALRALRECEERSDTPSESELALERVCDAWDALREEVQGSR